MGRKNRYLSSIILVILIILFNIQIINSNNNKIIKNDSSNDKASIKYIQDNPNDVFFTDNRNLLLFANKILEDSLNKIIFLKREIKVIDEKNFYEVTENYESMKKSLSKNREIINKFFNNLTANQKFSIKRQIDTIYISLTTLEKLFISIDKSLNKKDIEEIFNKTREIEFEFKTIYRQYKAIELILFEY